MLRVVGIGWDLGRIDDSDVISLLTWARILAHREIHTRSHGKPWQNVDLSEDAKRRLTHAWRGRRCTSFNEEKKMLGLELRDFRSFEPDVTYTWKLKLMTSTEHIYIQHKKLTTVTTLYSRICSKGLLLLKLPVRFLTTSLLLHIETT